MIFYDRLVDGIMLQTTQTEEKYLSQEPVFYLGVIEDDKDPTFANRYRVRLIGKDDESQEKLPTNMLPWCQCLNNIASGVGISTFYKKGTFVLVHLLQGLRNDPIIIGALQSTNDQNEEFSESFSDPDKKYPREEYKNKPDTNQKAVGEKYLKNYVFETESGHYVEIDDSEQDGRIHIYHRTGSLMLIDNDGNITINCVKNQTETIKDNLTINVADGNTSISTNSGTTSVYSKGLMTIKCDSDININGGSNINLNC